LIVGEETECTEKVLCFTAAGKHILRRTYLKESLNRKMFLDEKDFHISKRNQGFKLAKASLKFIFQKIFYLINFIQ
jgi:hypothetical protein